MEQQMGSGDATTTSDISKNLLIEPLSFNELLVYLEIIKINFLKQRQMLLNNSSNEQHMLLNNNIRYKSRRVYIKITIQCLYIHDHKN